MTRLPEPIPNTDLRAEPMSDLDLAELERQLRSDVLVRTQTRAHFLGLLARMRQAETLLAARRADPDRDALAHETAYLKALNAALIAERDLARAHVRETDALRERLGVEASGRQRVTESLQADLATAHGRLDAALGELEPLRRESEWLARADKDHATMRARAEQAIRRMETAQRDAEELRGTVDALQRDLATTRERLDDAHAEAAQQQDAASVARNSESRTTTRLVALQAETTSTSATLAEARQRLGILEARQKACRFCQYLEQGGD